MPTPTLTQYLFVAISGKFIHNGHLIEWFLHSLKTGKLAKPFSLSFLGPGSGTGNPNDRAMDQGNRSPSIPSRQGI
jgi:hypothetical protein